MLAPNLMELPPARHGQEGWPWTQAGPKLPDRMPGGRLWPSITVVTPSFNQGQFLEETIRSVLLQGYPRLEYIVMDGGSTDGSVEVIRKYEPWLSHWSSEPDAGQADAIRKGFELGTGERLNWLNSDDIYLPGGLLAVAALHAEQPEALLAFPVNNWDQGTGEETLVYQKGLALEPVVCLWKRAFQWHQPGLFFPREAYRQAGALDPSLRYSMDYDLLCRFLRLDVPIVYSDQPVVRFRVHRASKTSSENTAMALEAYHVSARYWPWIDRPRLYLATRMLIHLLLRGAKWFLQGELREALRSVSGGVRLFVELLHDPAEGHGGVCPRPRVPDRPT